MSGFHNINFPLPLAFGASGGPNIQTEIITLASGQEQRNASHSQTRRRYDAGVGVKSLSDIQLLVNFYEARRGQLYGFRFRDPIDNQADMQILGTSDGVQTAFQLIKKYTDSMNSWTRIITKPVPNSVRAFVNGVEMTGFTVDDQTGFVSFDNPPQNGAEITASFSFDVPVRFDTDHLKTSREDFGAGSAVNIPLLEVLPYA
ncbi:MAG: glycoside hydrolase family 24 [Robiginitomaculum sp.]|nr:MAG: glycoside hydrolase family 24 [Robiginitomaculum sp.]